jgi:hypothetical protein
MPTDLPESTERDLIKVIVRDVEDELGPILASSSTVIFPNMRKDRIIGKWIEQESSSTKAFVGYDNADVADQYTNDDLRILHKVILFRVCARALRTAQVNRKVGKSFSQPTYLEMMKSFQEEARKLSLYIREKYYPCVKSRDDEVYPPIPEEDEEV